MSLSVRALVRVSSGGFEFYLRADICEKRDRHFSRNARISWSFSGLIR
jgi:hypothetical protein